MVGFGPWAINGAVKLESKQFFLNTTPHPPLHHPCNGFPIRDTDSHPSMMHLPGQLQWDCKTIKPCHKRLHLLMSATSFHSITVVTHLLKSFKFLCPWLTWDLINCGGLMKINVYQPSRFVQEWVLKKIKNLTAPKIFHNTNNTPPLHRRESFISILYFMLKSIRILGTPISTMWRRIGLEELSPWKAHSHHLKD